MNKKADTAIAILVLLVVVTVSATLFSFATKGEGIKADISDSFAVEQVILEKNEFEFDLTEIGKEALYETYIEFVDDGRYSSLPVRYSGERLLFENLNPNLNEEFKNRFNEKFNQKTNEANKGFEDYSFDIEFDGENMNIIIKDFSVEKTFSEGDMKINYLPEINIQLNLEKEGIHGFQEIYEVKEKCKQDFSEQCFSELNNFEVVIDEATELVTLRSKKKFLISGGFRKIEIGFLVR